MTKTARPRRSAERSFDDQRWGLSADDIDLCRHDTEHAESHLQKELRRLPPICSRAGQVNGTQLGQLPNGYVPLPASLKSETLDAAKTILIPVKSGSTHHSTTGSHTPLEGIGHRLLDVDPFGEQWIRVVGAQIKVTARGLARSRGREGRVRARGAPTRMEGWSQVRSTHSARSEQKASSLGQYAGPSLSCCYSESVPRWQRV